MYRLNKKEFNQHCKEVATTKYDEIIKYLEDNNYVYDRPNNENGPMYILTDGRFVYGDFKCHALLDGVLVRGNILSRRNWYAGNGSLIMPYLKALRVSIAPRLNEVYIQLEIEPPTDEQYKALLLFIDQVFNQKLDLQVCLNGIKLVTNTYTYKEYIAEDIIKLIKKYYSVGRLEL